MDSAFADITPLWDLSQANSFSQLADDDFLALLQKQFPSSTEPTLSAGAFGANSIDPQDIARFSLPDFSPPSDDSSPSPPRNGDRERSDEDEDSRGDLKRKASDGDVEEGPSSKSQHTNSNNKKGGSMTRRKSGGPSDEGRLLKRKEQNRAAQRAFRERKEKHVKDLEDKVAALEARNEITVSENENLRDLLSRLQSENMTLKQAKFTFQAPKVGPSSPSPPSTGSSSFTSSFTKSSPKPMEKYTNPLDLSSLQSFDPTMLDLLDAPTEPTATSGASSMDRDFGFGRDGGYLTANFTTIASNPAYFSLASMFDSTPTPSPPTTNNSSSPNPNAYNFDVNNFQSWGAASDVTESGTLDDLFGNYLNPPSAAIGMSAPSVSSPASISPIVHHAGLSNKINTNAHSPTTSTSSSGSPSSQGSDPSLFEMPRDGNSSASDSDCGSGSSPQLRSTCTAHIKADGMSPFVTQSSFPRKDVDMPFGPVVSCQQGSSSFPQTSKNDKNVEVLAAWRTITSNPKFKDCDINELCTEFSAKAKCDGSKVVLEPSGVNSILSQLSKAKSKP